MPRGDDDDESLEEIFDNMTIDEFLALFEILGSVDLDETDDDDADGS